MQYLLTEDEFKKRLTPEEMAKSQKAHIEKLREAVIDLVSKVYAVTRHQAAHSIAPNHILEGDKSKVVYALEAMGKVVGMTPDELFRQSDRRLRNDTQTP